MKLTAWYSNDQEPVRAGVYQRDYAGPNGKEEPYFCFWDGEFWYSYAFDAEEAKKKTSLDASCFQSLPWRGVAR